MRQTAKCSVKTTIEGNQGNSYRMNDIVAWGEKGFPVYRSSVFHISTAFPQDYDS